MIKTYSWQVAFAVTCAKYVGIFYGFVEIFHTKCKNRFETYSCHFRKNFRQIHLISQQFCNHFSENCHKSANPAY